MTIQFSIPIASKIKIMGGGGDPHPPSCSLQYDQCGGVIPPSSPLAGSPWPGPFKCCPSPSPLKCVADQKGGGSKYYLQCLTSPSPAPGVYPSPAPGVYPSPGPSVGPVNHTGTIIAITIGTLLLLLLMYIIYTYLY